MSLKIYACSLAIVSALCGGPALAEGIPLERVSANNCFACHQLNAKRVGPSFRLIADRFAGNDGARDYLARAIRSGGRGRWGAIPMPAQPQVSEHDAEAIADWILELGKSAQ